MRDSTLLEGVINKKRVTLCQSTDGLEYISAERRQGLSSSFRFGCKRASGHENAADYVISYRHILNARVLDDSDTTADVVIEFAFRKKRNAAQTKLETWRITVTDKANRQRMQVWVNGLLENAYKGIKRGRRFKVIVNPFGGQGLAREIWKKVEPVFQSAGCTFDVMDTQYRGHAEETAHDLDVTAYDGVVCCSGDGIIHEVLNGLAKRKDGQAVLRQVPIGVLPGGSGNALAVNLLTPKRFKDLVEAAVGVIKGKKRKMPLAYVSIEGQKDLRVSFLSLAYGLSADSDIGSDHLRWMGDLRFLVVFIKTLFQGKRYDCTMHARIVCDSDVTSGTQALPSLKAKEAEPVQEEAEEDEEEANKKERDDSRMPELKYGRVEEKVPENWTKVGDKTWSFYAGTQPFVAEIVNQFPLSGKDELLDVTMIPAWRRGCKILSGILVAAQGGHVVGEDAACRYMRVDGYRIEPRGRGGKVSYVSVDGESVEQCSIQVESLGMLGRCFA